MFKKGFFVLIACSITVKAYSSLWTKTFGGGNYDCGTSVQQTADGGFIITGSTRSYGAGEDDVWLIRTDANGDTLWTKTYGGSNYDYGSSVQQTTDGGFIITGNTDSYGAGEDDVWLIRTDSNGDTLWTKTFGGGSWDYGSSVQQITDEGFIITGYTESYGAGWGDVWLIRTDANGDTLWTKTFGGSDGDYGSSVQQTTDGGFIITGSTESYGAGGPDVWLIRTDANGDTLWTKTYGGGDGDYGTSVQQTTDGGFIITGYTWSYGAGFGDVWLIRTNANGDTLWTKTYGGGGWDYSRSVQQTTDRGFIITGSTKFYGAVFGDVWLIRTDANGDTLWTKTFGGSSEDDGNSVQQTTDGGFIITGGTYSYGAGSGDVWLIRTDSNGNTINKYVFLLYPNNRGSWLVGSVHTIIWRLLDDWGVIPFFRLQLSTDAGNSYSVIVDSIPGDIREWDWIVPNTPSDSCKIRVDVMDFDYELVVYDESDNNFIIRQVDLEVKSPNGGEVLFSDSVYLIEWDIQGKQKMIGFYRISFSSDGGSSYEIIKDSLSGLVSNWNWRTPRINSNSCRIKITAMDLTYTEVAEDISDSNFTITKTGIEELMQAIRLEISPNPVWSKVVVSYKIPSKCKVSLKLYDIVGRIVSTLVDEEKASGEHIMSFDTKELAIGIYFIRMLAGRNTLTKKLILAK